MATRHRVFVSFDFDHDRRYKYLLEAWNANPRFQFIFRDETPGEINSTDIGRIKAGLTMRINEATHTLVLVGQFANAPHPKRLEIGERNWINWEIWRSRAKSPPNRIAAVMLEPNLELPERLTDTGGVTWARKFEEAAIIDALARA